MQGFEIDQLFDKGDKRPVKGGKRCRGFSERKNIEYDA